MFKHILVGYDGSDTSQRGFELAMALARASGGRVRVVSVLQVTEAGSDACALMMADSGTARAQELLDELKTLQPDAGALVDVDLAHGSPGDVLLTQLAQRAPIDVEYLVEGPTEWHVKVTRKAA